MTDRGLAAGLAASGWPVDQLRAALAKSYTVDFLAVSRFLNSEAGERFLRRATTSYGPYDRMNTTAVPALRSAILSDAVDGSISSAGILRALPTAFRLADNGNGHTGGQPICAPGHCRSGTAQCTSLLSWYAFLPGLHPGPAGHGVGGASACRFRSLSLREVAFGALGGDGLSNRVPNNRWPIGWGRTIPSCPRNRPSRSEACWRSSPTSSRRR